MNLIYYIKAFLTSQTVPQLDQNQESIKKFDTFFEIGKNKGYFSVVEDKVRVKEETIRDWMRHATRIRLLSEDEFNHGELDQLKGAFIVCISLLAVIAMISLGLVIKETSTLTTILSAGVLGSSLTAFISCLDRRAAGFEDSNGKSYPLGNANKGQFNRGMFNWLLLRPLLGLTALFVYYWIDDMGFNSNQETTIAFVSGLMAKTVISAFKEWPKVFLKV